jgi:hypothetical protein
MRTRIEFVLGAMALVAASACGEGAPLGGYDEGVVDSHAAPVSLEGELPHVGQPGRPSNTFTPATGLSLARIRATQLGGEALVLDDLLGSETERYRSAHYHVERRQRDGEAHITLREDQYAPPLDGDDVDRGALEQAALARLAALGISPEEIAAVRQRRVFAVDSESRPRPRTFAHATFVERGFHGIRVLGSRALVVHDRAGRFSKLLLDWPAVAPEAAGHQWGTSMSVPAIVARASAALAERGLAERGATLSYAYVQVATDAQGRAVFALKCLASVAGLLDTDPDGPDRPRDLVIDLDP